MKQLMVIAKFTYRDHTNNNTFTVERAWPCRDQQDAQHILQRHAIKTGALNAQFIMEELEHEEIKQSAASIATA